MILVLVLSRLLFTILDIFHDSGPPCNPNYYADLNNLLLIYLFQSGRKETVLDLAKFVDKGVQVKLTGGRQGLLSMLYYVARALISFASQALYFENLIFSFILVLPC